MRQMDFPVQFLVRVKFNTVVLDIIVTMDLSTRFLFITIINCVIQSLAVLNDKDECPTRYPIIS